MAITDPSDDCRCTVYLPTYRGLRFSMNARGPSLASSVALSIQSYIASFLEQNFIYYSYLGKIASRLGKRLLYPWEIFPCQDGLIFLAVGEPDQWQRLLELMGNPEWGSWEIFKDLSSRSKNQDVLRLYLAEWVKEWRVADLFHTAQKRRLCFAPVLTMAEMAEQEQLRSRRFFVEVTHPQAGTLMHLGPPYQLHEPWWKIRRPAPLVGEHNTEILHDASAPHRPTPSVSSLQPSAAGTRLPLDGIRVADFTWVWAGPFCTMHLAHLGAEVIKIESQARLDLTRRLPFYPADMEPGVNRCALFNQWGQGKKSLLLNLVKPEAVAIAKELIQKSDIVVENFATGVMRELLGYSAEEMNRLKEQKVLY